MSDLIETAEKLMALGDFRWWDAMADTDGDRVVDGRDQGRMMLYYFGDRAADRYDASCMAPLDLNDPGTQGCVMAWCEEVFGDKFHIVEVSGGWAAEWRAHFRVCIGARAPTKIEAACAALLGVR